MDNRTNIIRLKSISNLLKGIDIDVVFVGGATVALYTDQLGGGLRPTDDVDVVVELATYSEFAALENRLRSIGFENDQDSKIVCRYKIEGLIVDIMPTDENIIGFSNRWYKEGYQHAVLYQLDNMNSIKIFSLPYFLASKIEAFRSRGNSNYIFSSDFEDIVYVLENNRSNIMSLMSENIKPSVKDYLKKAFSKMLNEDSFEEGLVAHLAPLTAEQQLERIVNELKMFCEG